MSKRKHDRIVGRFTPMPHWLIEHPAYRAASYIARALLVDVSVQYMGSNNGSLVVCEKALKPLGWNSNASITKAKRELVELGLLIETRRGARPNRAAWYAMAWNSLDVTDGLDIDPRSYMRLTARLRN